MSTETLAEGPIRAPMLLELLSRLGRQGADDVAWSENVKPPHSPEHMAMETIWILCNSGMKHSVARIIEGRVRGALEAGRPVSSAFGHPGKAAAMQDVWDRRQHWFDGFVAAEDKLAFIATIPWIGKITKYHLAKNLGIDCAKPDVHLARLAGLTGEGVHEMCARLAAETGYRVSTVDLILWRACATGVLDSRTGSLRAG